MPDLTAQYGSLPFEGAIRFFRQKVRLPTRAWTDIQHGMHARAFVIAGATKDELLADFQGAIDKAIAQGTTLDQFRRQFDGIVVKHGWEYNGGRNWRSRVIYETNIRTAYMAARYEQMTHPDVLKARPFWEYRHGDSLVPRPMHLAWDRLVLPASSPWWQTHWPPNGWGCKCKVFALNRRDLEKMGKSAPDEAPPLDLQKKRLGRNGPVVEVPAGVDPGFGYNVGEAAWGRPVAKRVLDAEAGGKWRDLVPWGPERYGRPAEIPADATRTALAARVGAADEAGLRSALRSAIGAKQAYYTDPAGARVMVNQAIIDHMLEEPSRADGRERYWPFIGEVIESPFEIWVNFAQNELTGQVALRRRFVKRVDLGEDRSLGMVAEAVQGTWVGFTFFARREADWHGMRSGRLLWARPETKTGGAV